MSSTSSIDIDIAAPLVVGWQRRVVEILLSSGWEFDKKEGVEYLPQGDSDNFDWCKSPISTEYFFDVVNKKNTLNEIIGVVMYFNEVGGELLLFPSGKVSLSLSINRCLCDGVVDVTWYLKRLVLPLKLGGIRIENIQYIETS